VKPATVGMALRHAAKSLSEAGVVGASRDARYLMAEALGVPRDRLVLNEPDFLEAKAAERFAGFVAERAARKPVSRILGRRDFYGRSFKITPYVLDPRPETEILIEAALAVPFEKVLDLGTGSGCILLTLLAESGAAIGVATDVSADALEAARENAALLEIESRAKFVESDWFSDVHGVFDLIVSNPPYIAVNEMPSLAAEVALFDPQTALTDDKDGLSAYRAIAQGAQRHLRPGGRLIVEIGPTQAGAVRLILERAGFSIVQVHSDLDGRDRIIEGHVAAT